MVAQLIEIHNTLIGEIEVKGVNSRDIHTFIGSKQQYADWIKSRLDELGAVDGVDFIIHKFMNHELKRNNKWQEDVLVTLDIAKHLAMMERNEKGKQARQYFIEVEKELHKPMTVEMLLEQNMKMISDLKAQNVVLEHKIAEDRPKVSYAEAIAGSVTPISLRDWISSLKSDMGLPVGERKVIDYLMSEGYIYRDKKGNLRAYKDYYEFPGNKKGYFSLIPVSTATPKGNREFAQLKVTGLGQLELGNEVIENFNPGGSVA